MSRGIKNEQMEGSERRRLHVQEQLKGKAGQMRRAEGAPMGGGHSVIGFDVSFPCIIGFFCCPGFLPDCRGGRKSRPVVSNRHLKSKLAETLFVF